MSTVFTSSANCNSDFIEDRLKIDYLLDAKAAEKNDIQDLISGLQNTPKSIPVRYFYDSQGSQLFEQICQLPEYYPTRTEASILKQYATKIVEQTMAVELVELGSGSSTKTRYLLDVYQNLHTPLYYSPVDVSDTILKDSAYELLADYPQLKIQGKVATYDRALEQISSYVLGRRTIIFLGSSIGNFKASQCDRFIDQVTAVLNPGDYFLLGIDLQKPRGILEAAYNDSQGITAAFNLNMLQHLNHRFQGNFNLDLFKHQALYNSDESQIEMYLISQQEQSITLKDLNLTLKLNKGEKILTEISRKFNLEKMKQYLNNKTNKRIEGQNLNLIQTYTDEQQWFGLLLCQKQLPNP